MACLAAPVRLFTRRVFPVLRGKPLWVLCGMLVSGLLGCTHTPSATPAVGDPLAKPPDAVKFSRPLYQAFFADLQQDCLDPNQGRVSTPDRPVSEAQMQSYCACYIETFKELFSETELDTFLQEDKPLDERKLDRAAQTCSPELD